MLITYRLLSKEQAAEAFALFDPDIQEKLINGFTEKELKNVKEKKRKKSDPRFVGISKLLKKGGRTDGRIL